MGAASAQQRGQVPDHGEERRPLSDKLVRRLGLACVSSYRARWLPKDVVAGLVLTALLVPQGMAYAELAGLPAITGLPVHVDPVPGGVTRSSGRHGSGSSARTPRSVP